MKTLFILLIIWLSPASYQQKTQTNCEKCSVNILVQIQDKIDSLTFSEIEMFFCTIEDSCRNNIEFSEFTSELLFLVFKHYPRLSLKVLSKSSESKCKIILNKLSSPTDLIDLNATYFNVESVRGHRRIKNEVLNSLRIALEKYKVK